MCIFVGRNQSQWIDVATFHTQAVYELLKNQLWNKLSADEQEELVSGFEFFEEVHLGDWQPAVFKEAFDVLMASEDDFITPMRDDFERAFKSDERFQVA